MRTFRLGFTGFLAALLFVSVNGCGKQRVTVAPPAVQTVTPANGTIGVPTNQVVTATFNKAMNPVTVSSATFTLAGPGGATVTSGVSLDATGSIASLTPGAALAYNTLYTATVTTGAADTLGDQTAGNYSWSFTTVAQPTVLSTTPASGAAGVRIGQVLSATFSKAMNAATITQSTFTLTAAGGASIGGAVLYTATGSVASFTPNTNLAYNTVYTATITIGATDTTGVPLASNYSWTFTTGAGPVVLSTTPANGATGVPVNQVLSATFNKAMNCATLATPATNFTVTGPGSTNVAGTVSCAGAVATFTPSAILATNTLYTAKITTAATDTTGLPLAVNYVWSFRTVSGPTTPTVIATTPSNGATAVPVNQAVTATFNGAMNATTITGTTFTLKAGGVSVTGVVTYVAGGSVATFTPAASLTASTVYTATITTGAQDLGGNALASNFVWTFTTAASTDATRPTVVLTIPLNAATGVPINQVVSATFSKAMNAATINSTTFTVTGPGTTPVTGLVAYASVGNTATFTPAASLAINTLFTATITTGAQDLAGNAVAVNYVWTFTTGSTLNTTKPLIVLTTPANTATGVALNQAVSATFSEAMNPLTISTATFQVTGPASAPVAGIVSYDPVDFIATFTPSAPLTASSSYIATITTGATDTFGNSLGSTGAANPWTFSTGTTVATGSVNMGTAALFGGFGGNAGITNQGIFTVINGNLGTTGVSTLITGFHDNGPGCIYTETPLNVGLVNGTIDAAQ
jgi:hypothetical protein